MISNSNNTKHQPGSMSCAEFQENLPELFATGENRIAEDSLLHEHLSTCDNCSALVRDLQYIAEQAKLLLQTEEEEPSEIVWKKIQQSIDNERMHHSAAPRGPV